MVSTYPEVLLVYIKTNKKKPIQIRSVAAGFGRHSVPRPASNDTSTALGQDGSD